MTCCKITQTPGYIVVVRELETAPRLIPIEHVPQWTSELAVLRCEA
jgi:hypothetical protein